MGCNGKSKNTRQESGHANASDCRCSCFPAHGADTCGEPISEVQEQNVVGPAMHRAQSAKMHGVTDTGGINRRRSVLQGRAER